MFKSHDAHVLTAVGIVLILVVCFLADKIITHNYTESNAALAVTLTDLGYKPVLINHRCLVPIEGFWMACNDVIVYNRLPVVVK